MLNVTKLGFMQPWQFLKKTEKNDFILSRWRNI